MRRALLFLIPLTLLGCKSHTLDADAGPRRDAEVGGDAATRDAGPLGCTLPTPVEHRASGSACPMDRPAGFATMDAPGCTADSDCTDGMNGRCNQSRFDNVCSYDQCFADADCGTGACLCRGAAGGVGAYGTNACIGGDCRVDSDCGPGGFCSPSLGDCGDYSGIQSFHCHTCDDECTDDDDCDAPGTPGGGYCAYNPLVGHWACSYQQCAG
ncbi:MAG: hypothetical protein AB7S26_24730 [Sandaracinaceae bacterium]